MLKHTDVLRKTEKAWHEVQCENKNVCDIFNKHAEKIIQIDNDIFKILNTRHT